MSDTGTAFTVDVSNGLEKMERLGIVFKPIQFTKAIGVRWLEWINENFRAQGKEEAWKPLSPNTIVQRRMKGSGGAQILRDTGHLAQSFVPGSADNVNTVDESQVSVGTRDKKAAFHHFGTKAYDIVPTHAKTLAFETVNGFVFPRKVHHPGLPIRRLLPSRALAESLALQIVRAKIAQAVSKVKGGAA